METITNNFEPDVGSRWNYRNINNVNVYDFMDDAFTGGGGFRNGRYLVPHHRESMYDMRRQLSYYKNYLKPIVRAMVDRVFSEKINRTVYNSGNTIVSDDTILDFIEDCDNNGTHIQKLIEQAIYRARLHGVVFIVMDNFAEMDMPETINEAREARAFPYIYIKKIQSVGRCEIGKWGQIEEISFYLKTEKRGKKEIDIYQAWNREYYWTEYLEKKDGKDVWVVDGPAQPNELGAVPVIPIFFGDRGCENKVFVDPPLYDLARINHTLYNKDSEMREIERDQEFSIFYIQTDNPGNLQLGTKNFVAIPTTSNIAPGFASPDGNVMAQLRENENLIREDLYRIAEQNGVVGVTDSSSGIAKQWDFWAHESVLKTTADVAEKAEKQIIEMFKQYIGSENEYDVQYPRDFSVTGDKDTIETADKLIMIGYPPMATAIIKEKAFRAFTADQNQEKVMIAIDEIYDGAVDETEGEKEPDTEGDDDDSGSSNNNESV